MKEQASNVHALPFDSGSSGIQSGKKENAMSVLRLTTVAICATLVLGACSSDGSGIGGMSESQTVGTGAGAAAGALAGYLITGGTTGTLIGAAAGALIGNRIGNHLEGDETKAAAHAAARAAEVPTDERVTWKKTGTLFGTTANGWASPTAASFTDNSGRTCREIHQWAEKDGKTYEDDVTLCRDPSGWVPA